MDGLEGLEGFRGGFEAGLAARGAGGGEPADAVAVLPQESEGALVLAAEHDFVALEKEEDVGGVGEGAEGFRLNFAGGKPPGGEIAGDEFLDEVGFHATDAAEAVLGVGHFHDEVHFGRTLGRVLGEVGVAKGDEVFRRLVVEERSLGEEAVLEGVLGRARLALGGLWTGGLLRIGAPGSQLAFREGA